MNELITDIGLSLISAMCRIEDRDELLECSLVYGSSLYW